VLGAESGISRRNIWHSGNQNQRPVMDYAEPDWCGWHELITESKYARKESKAAPAALEAGLQDSNARMRNRADKNTRAQSRRVQEKENQSGSSGLAGAHSLETEKLSTGKSSRQAKIRSGSSSSSESRAQRAMNKIRPACL
jgi:hypothetical protein